MKVVEYTGQAHRRRITVRDWKLAGTTGPDVEWSWENGFAVDGKLFGDDQLAALATMPAEFAVVEMDKLPGRLAHRMTPVLAKQLRVASLPAVLEESAEPQDDEVEPEDSIQSDRIE